MAPTDEAKIDAAKAYIDSLPPEARKRTMVNNDGEVVVNNRAYRRRKPPTDPRFTKATHSLRKKRENAKKNKHNR